MVKRLLQSLVGELSVETHFNHYMIWRSLGSLPEIMNIAEGKPKQNYEAYHLRPGLKSSNIIS